MDEDSILFQAMKNEMYPQVDPAAMKFLEPGAPYPTGVEVRTPIPGSNTGGVANPLRMMRTPNDFTGRPLRANDNPARAGQEGPHAFEYGLNRTQMRPSENVINQYQDRWQQERIANEMNRKMMEIEGRYPKLLPGQQPAESPGLSQRVLRYMREMFNANRSPDWWKNF